MTTTQNKYQTLPTLWAVRWEKASKEDAVMKQWAIQALEAVAVYNADLFSPEDVAEIKVTIDRINDTTTPTTRTRQ